MTGKKCENVKEYESSWYSLTPNRLLATLGAPKGEINCDVCVVGAGFTGLSAALELAQKGYSVVVLEAETIGAGASGRNGGHLQRGYIHSPATLAGKFDPATAKHMCNWSLEALGLLIARIQKHDIKCDLKFGHLTAAENDKHKKHLKEEIDAWAKIGHNDLQYLDEAETQGLVKTKRYTGGLFDPKGGHFHPLNYALGLARALQVAGGKIYEKSPVTEIRQGDPAKVFTAQGKITAKYVVLGGMVNARGVEGLSSKVITATAHVIATEPLGPERAHNILTKDIAVIDANFIMNYFRLSEDRRLIFGGNCNYSDRDYKGQDEWLRRRMVSLFPKLALVGLDHCWRGKLDITLNRLPHMGRFSPNIFYAHGYSGHGVILSNMAGKLIADAVSGTAEKFDVFTKIKHHDFIGGSLLKRPLFMLGMLWFRLRDLLP